MNQSYTQDQYMKELVAMALAEDAGNEGDVTSQAIFQDEQDTFVLYVKQPGVLCGQTVFQEVFRQVDPDVQAVFSCGDGAQLVPGQSVASVSGRVLSILTAERTAINFLALLSGIATRARLFADRAGDRAVILDTRKTLPGFRELAKYAVTCGGAANHRRGLYDMVLIKDNHIDAAGGITPAVGRIRERWGDRFPVEVEARNLREVEEALECSVDRIMLDNMDCGVMRQAVSLVSGRSELEASGNITLERVEDVSRTGVDFISVGEITHSVTSLDFSLKRGV